MEAAKDSQTKGRRTSIDTSIEFPYRLNDLGEYLPNRPGYKTLYHYATTGMSNHDGTKLVILETVKIGGCLHSTVEAFHRMVAEANR